MKCRPSVPLADDHVRVAQRLATRLRGETDRRRFGLPFLGEGK
jgi:hypothetical protein